MCEIYVKADPILYECRSRSLRLHGAVTTIRLENMFWDVLSDIAGREGITTNELIAELHDEVLEHRSELSNMASFLRVSCLRYLVCEEGNGRTDATVPARRSAAGQGGAKVVRLAVARV